MFGLLNELGADALADVVDQGEASDRCLEPGGVEAEAVADHARQDRRAREGDLLEARPFERLAEGAGGIFSVDEPLRRELVFDGPDGGTPFLTWPSRLRAAASRPSGRHLRGSSPAPHSLTLEIEPVPRRVAPPSG